MLLNGFPGSSGTADRSGEQTRLLVKTSSFGCSHACLSISLRGSSAGVSYALLIVFGKHDSDSMWPRCCVRGLGTGQSAHGVDRETAAWDVPPLNI